MTTHKVVPVTKEQALKALEDMDDFAGMTVSVNAFGARETLRRFIEQATPAPSGEAVSIRDFQIRCHADRDISNALAEAMARLPACPLNALVSGALQEIEALRYQVAHPPAERDAEDAARLDWLEQAASARKVELAKSLYGTGFEIGEWPSMRVTMRKGSLRDAIDAARQGEGNE